MKIFRNRYRLLYNIVATYVLISAIVRLILIFFTPDAINAGVVEIFKMFITGFCFDFAVALCFAAVYSLYLLALPSKLVGSKLDKTVTYIIISLTIFIQFFAFAAEFPFWDEFKTRFNCIAVDYLMYTYEVVENINQSYPVPLILAGLFAGIFLLFFIFKKLNVFRDTFSDKMKLGKRSLHTGSLLLMAFLSIFFLKNEMAEQSQNAFVNELSKNGVFSFFSALRSNELDYQQFYSTLPEKEEYKILKNELLQEGDIYTT